MSRSSVIVYLAGFLVLSCVLFLGEDAFGAESSLRCGTRLVSVGDSKAEVLIKCGAPDWKDNWTDEIAGHEGGHPLFLTVDRERWIYNFGPNSFLRFLLFENGRLVEIATGDHGYNEGQAHGVCDINQIGTGLTQYEVMQKCGEPFFKDDREEERFIKHKDRGGVRIIVHIEEWTYNFGPNQFLRILKFENGRLVDIQTGDRGF